MIITMIIVTMIVTEWYWQWSFKKLNHSHYYLHLFYCDLRVISKSFHNFPRFFHSQNFSMDESIRISDPKAVTSTTERNSVFLRWRRDLVLRRRDDILEFEVMKIIYLCVILNLRYLLDLCVTLNLRYLLVYRVEFEFHLVTIVY